MRRKLTIRRSLQKDAVPDDNDADVSSLANGITTDLQIGAGIFDSAAPYELSENVTDDWSFPNTLADNAYQFNVAGVGSSGVVDSASATILGSANIVVQASDAIGANLPVMVADGATTEIDGVNAQSVTFSGATGTLVLKDSLGFTGQVSGFTGSDVLDLSDISYGGNTTATFSGNADGGVLTITDGTDAASITLEGSYLSSTWDLSSDGNGGTIVIDPVASNNWQTLDVGAGGWLTGIDVAPDGTMVVRTDTYGAYIWNGTEWQQLVTSTSMPAAFVTPNLDDQGVYEIQIAPSNSNILYMIFEGYVFQSTNKGTSWTETNFAPVTVNTTDNARIYGQKMAIDPENPNIVYVGTIQNGLFVTSDGGITWQSVSEVPVRPDGSGITGIEFDPALGVTGGKTNTIFAASDGNGVYQSTNGGVSWSAIGGPTDVVYSAVSATGIYYATDGTTLWSFQNGKWTQLLSNNQLGIETVAINPSNPNEIVVQAVSGQINLSYNGGTTWSGFDSNYQLDATDVPWLATTGSWMSIGGTVFNPLVPNELISSAGVGVWTTNIPTSGFTSDTSVTWTSQSSGIEQLVANQIVVPPGGNPVLASWDRPFFYIANANAYPSTYSPNTGNTLTEGWSVNYASSDPSFLVGIADNWGLEESGYSTDGGQTWTPFPSFIPGAGTEFIGGTIAASTPANIIWAPAGGFDPYYTLNGGETWNPITLPGVSNWSGFDFSSSLDAITVTADRVLPNTFYLYYAGDWAGAPAYGVYVTTNGGSSWTQVYSGEISSWSMFNAELQSVPGEAGNLFFTGGPQSGDPNEPFMFSSNGGSTWTAVANVTEVNCFGFGAAAPGQSYPSIYIVGWVNNVYGIWQSVNNAQSWTQIGTYPAGDLDEIKTISGDPNNFGQVYVGFAGSGYAYLAAGPGVTGIAASPSSSIESVGDIVTLTLNLSEAVTVAGGTPTLTLNDGGTATYSGGSGSSALTFSYTVAAGQNTSDLTATAVNLNAATVKDSAGNAANLSLSGLSQAGPQINTSESNVNNSGTIEALGSNTKVVIDSEITNAATGLILASGNGANVVLDGATISGGTLKTTGRNAVIETVSGSANVLDDVTISSGSTVEISGGSTLMLNGDVANAGTLAVNGGILNIDGLVTGGTVQIRGAGVVEIAQASSENVAFLANATGQLVLDHATSYSGEITGFGANTSQTLDLTDLNFAAGVQIVSYVPNNRHNTSGILTVTDGTNTAQLQLEGGYTLANFQIANDGNGGTLITDPEVITPKSSKASVTIGNNIILEVNAPDMGKVNFSGTSGTLWLDQPSTFTGTVSGFGAQDIIDLPGIAFDAQTTLGYLPNSKQTGGTLSITNGTNSANIALLGNYMASSFVVTSDSHGGTMVVAASTQLGSHSLLTNPQ